MLNFIRILFLAVLAISYGYAETKNTNNTTNQLLHRRLVPFIAGGKLARIGAFPYQTSLRYQNRHVCGGAVINERWILTAAHCLELFSDVDEVLIYVGSNKISSGGWAYGAEKIIKHPKFSLLLKTNDIGLIKANETIKFNKFVKPVRLPVYNNNNNNYPAVVSGWGADAYLADYTDELHYLETRLLNRLTCIMKTINPFISSKKICAFTRIAEGCCNGDSGGPLVSDGNIVGVVSYGFFGCAGGKPDVYTRVYSYLSWINYKMTG